MLVVDAQPLRSPWWTYADADASYTSSALNLMLGREVSFVDHPGLPITEAVAVAFGVQVLVEEQSLSERARLAFVDRTLLDLDSARGTFRGFGIAFYLAGALLSFLLAARLFGHWSWGLASGLMWIAAPGLAAMSIQLRPDVLLAVLSLVFAFAIARALETRSIVWFAGAAALVGFATMVKLHALALLPALAVAAAWRPADGRASRLPDRRVLGLVAAPWLLVALLVNAGRFPFGVTDGQAAVLAIGITIIAAALVAARLIPALRFASVLLCGFAAGLLVPVTISVPEGLRSLVYVARNVSGNGVQEGIEPFSTPLADLGAIVGDRVVLLFVAALLAGVLGVVRRDPLPVVWAVAGLSMGAMAYARPPNVHYFAPSFLFAVLGLLWLLRREPRTRASLLVWPVVLFFVLPAWDVRGATAAEQQHFAGLVAPAKEYVDAHLRPGEVALVPSYWPFADSRFFELVEIYVEHTPNYPYRYLPTTSGVRPFAAVRLLRPRYYVGPQAVGLTVGTRVQLGELGEYTLVPANGPELVAEIVQGPGVTESW